MTSKVSASEISENHDSLKVIPLCLRLTELNSVAPCSSCYGFTLISVVDT